MNIPRVQRLSRPAISRDLRGNSAQLDNLTCESEVLTGNCVALIDARFLGWLLGIDCGNDEVDDQLMPTQELLVKIKNLLTKNGVRGQLLRVYWYVSKQPDQLVNHVVIRIVNHLRQDAGLGVVRAISDDLRQLALSHSVEHVLLASDDERLWAAVDQSQLSGICLHMLCDDSVYNFSKLQQDDPTWARLLSQADRRMVWSDTSTSFIQTENVAITNLHQIASDFPDVNGDAIVILEYIKRWWSEESEVQRDELREVLHQSRSIPQELDRQLLLRLSRELGHPLSWPDKKVMREGLRRTVLGGDGGTDTMIRDDLIPAHVKADRSQRQLS